MNIENITHLSLNLGPDVGANDALIGVRVVPVGRDGNKIIVKTLNHGEPDTGESVRRGPGESLLLPPGNMRITIQDIDKENTPHPDGYAALSNTIWTWLQTGRSPDPVLFRFLFAAARRLDTAHDVCADALDQLAQRPDEPFIKSRARLFRALGYAELMCVAFRRATRMITLIPNEFTVSAAVPKTVDAIVPPLKEIRDALEHIEERAFEIVNDRGDLGPDALTIFDQGDFYSLGVLRYGSHSLDIKADVVPALISARQFIFNVAVEKAGSSMTNNVPMEFFQDSRPNCERRSQL